MGRNSESIRRRDLLRAAGVAAGALASHLPGSAQTPAGRSIAVVIDPADPILSSAPAAWAAAELERALTESGAAARRARRLQDVRAGEWCIQAASQKPASAEALSLSQLATGRVLARGGDARGVVYALLEMADRVRRLHLDAALRLDKPVNELPANPVRSVMRQFTSEPLDKKWFYDRDCWQQYLTMLAVNRFNRLNLTFGLGYDALTTVADSYFLFLYPFLLSVPGYNVRASNLPDVERDRNLEMLRWISEQTVLHGLDFQLGVWMHGYRLGSGSRAKYIVEGLTDATQAPYCRDALTALLKACPAISSVALRIHGESGVAEGSYDFWKTIFDGVARCGRKVEIDLHAKGIDAQMINNALATGMPVNVSPKYWAEHLGLPYHQAAIRELELPTAGQVGRGLMTLSEGQRVFTRYGYADLMRDDRRYTIRHRVFSGTQRLLAWGDPAWAASYARAFRFCGSTGADLMEPLTCMGRRGSTAVTTRCAYADASLEPRYDWQKFDVWYRVWGRALYNPDSVPPAATSDEKSLAPASRILPLITTAHLPSAACDAFWPELYWNHAIADTRARNPYGDSPAPRNFQNVSPLDPQLFSSIKEFAGELLKGERSGKYTPLEVADWLDTYAAAAAGGPFSAGVNRSVASRRVTLDIQILSGLAKFYSAKLRAGVLYAVFEETSDAAALNQALDRYRAARQEWANVAAIAKDVYQPNLGAGDRFSVQGHWSDRLALIDADIAAMEQKSSSAKIAAQARIGTAIAEAMVKPMRDAGTCRHQPSASFRKKEALAITVAVPDRKPAGVRLYYRHVNQAERWQSLDMSASKAGFRGAIPAEYTDSPYALQYYFEVREARSRAWLSPGLGPELDQQPYYVVQHA
jgi:hypothetical protein